MVSNRGLFYDGAHQIKFDFDFLKDRYDYELQRREQLTAALTLPVGVLTVLGGAMAAMARSFSYKDGLLTWVFGILLGLAVIAFFLCMLNLGRTYHRQTYIYLPLLGDLHKVREEWRAFYEEAHHRRAADDSFQQELEASIIGAADRNTRSNDQRSRYLFWSRLALFAVLVSTAMMGIPYVVDQVRY